jgi:recombination protein O
MQGYIINLNKVKDEDLIVTIISKGSLETLYRFYGARHGVINLGFKIDYEIEESAKSTIGRMKDVVHIGYKWINDYKLLKLWQDFTALFHRHLIDAEELDDFYFELLDYASEQWNKQNPKRVAIESYVKLLENEGRLHTELNCFLCSLPIQEKEISIIRAFLPTHKACSHTLGISDKEVERLWYVLIEGL